MPTSRRNVIIGLGALTAGGGAVLGSGAFTTTTADRGLEINVITGEQIAEESVDVILRQNEYDQVGVDGDASSLAPESETVYENSSGSSIYTADAEEVSLLENDVTTIFGPEGNKLLGRSKVSFDDLFKLINLDDGEQTNADVTFDIDGVDTEFELDDTTISGGGHTIGVDSGESESASLAVIPDDESDDEEAGELTITIEER